MDIEKKIKAEIKEEEQKLITQRDNLIHLAEEITIDWDDLADLDSCVDSIHNSIIWILALKEVSEK